MKTKFNKKGLILLPVVFAVILFLVFTDDNQVSVQESQQSFELQFEEIIELECDENGENCVEVTINSVLPTQPKISESDDDFLTGILDSLSTEQIAIETVATKYNLAGQTQVFRSASPFQLQSASVSTEGFFIENIQVAFFVDVKESSSIDIEGTAIFKLKGEEVARQRIFASSPSIEGNQIALNVGSSGVETFDFTFTDEGFVDGTVHTFEVILDDISGELLTGGQRKTVTWDNPLTVYKLDLVADKDRITRVTESGDVVSVLKSDGAVVVCANGEWKYDRKVGTKKTARGISQIIFERQIPPATTNTVIIEDVDGNEVDRLNSFTGSEGRRDCKKIENLQRGSDYVINVDGQSFPISFPDSPQKNFTLDYNIRCTTKCIDGAGNNSELHLKVESNFGFEIDNKPI